MKLIPVLIEQITDSDYYPLPEFNPMPFCIIDNSALQKSLDELHLINTRGRVDDEQARGSARR